MGNHTFHCFHNLLPYILQLEAHQVYDTSISSGSFFFISQQIEPNPSFFELKVNLK